MVCKLHSGKTSSNLWRQFLGCLHFYRRLDTSTILSCTLRARSPFPAPFRTRLRSAPSLAISGDDTFFFPILLLFPLLRCLLFHPIYSFQWHRGRRKSRRRTTQTKKPLMLRITAILDEDRISYTTHNRNPLPTRVSCPPSPKL